MVRLELEPTEPVLSALMVPDAAQPIMLKIKIVAAIAKLVLLRINFLHRVWQTWEGEALTWGGYSRRMAAAVIAITKK